MPAGCGGRLLMKFTGEETKEELLYKGIELIERFSEDNGIKMPKIFVVGPSRISAYGLFYPNDIIHVNMKLCRPPVKVPGYDWTFPGYIQDLTPYGILAHEFGHYISDMLGKKFRKNFVNIRKIEENVTSTDDRGLDEKMAEAARLFITNPDLLRIGRPYRYEIFSRHYTPVVKHRWKTVLKNAHPKIISAAERWIERGYIKK
jgi:hypothetical protein